MARTAEIMFKEFHHRYNSEDACRVDSIDEEITGLAKFQRLLHKEKIQVQQPLYG